ncbi:MAG: CDP-diacylglycerol--glycerol-3-phosphate 3-phosphatidyltransferase [Defluviitaleaceae bacterium]|nr:CDP-diacylglycerol--glycerol-3-phosphate 3-phosphatidyltransferase [Defluviitaleaceae bacterium]
MNLANKITILRVCMIPAFLAILWVGESIGLGSILPRILAAIIFVAAAITDAIDGHIARKRNMITTFGKFMDPLADKLLVVAALISLVAMGEIYAWVVILIVAREFVISGFRMLAATKGLVIAASFWGKLKTIIQMVMIPYLLVGLPWLFFPILGQILVYISVALTVISAVDYITKNKHVIRE